jgi:hypothetical protein
MSRKRTLWRGVQPCGGRQGLRACHPPAPDGVHRSEVFPGLWLDARALFAEDLDPLFATLEVGLASSDHAAFVAGLAARRVEP